MEKNEITLSFDIEKMRALEFYLRKENAAAPVKAVVVPAAQLREASV